jgi:hypothetical protein
MNSWLRSAKDDFDMPKDRFFETYRDHINGLLARSQVTMATDPTDPTFIHGYIVYQKVADVFLLHWAYVKKDFRRLGVMSRLIESQYPELGEEPLIITYKNDKRKAMFTALNMVYRPEYRSLKA